MTDKAITSTELQARVNEYQHWYHGFEVAPGVFTNGAKLIGDITHYLKKFKISSIAGKRILDIATFDGGYAFGFERLGAEVVAQDVVDQTRTGFAHVKPLIGSAVVFHCCSVYDLDPERLGTFDLVHFKGLIYHLKHPYLALEKINGVLRTGGIVFGSGASGENYFSMGGKKVSLARDFPALNQFPVAFYVKDKFRGDPTNWILFNNKGFEALLSRSGFEVEFVRSTDNHDEEVTSTAFKGIKVRQPDPEYFDDNHMLRRPPNADPPKRRPARAGLLRRLKRRLFR